MIIILNSQFVDRRKETYILETPAINENIESEVYFYMSIVWTNFLIKKSIFIGILTYAAKEIYGKSKKE